MKRTCTFLAAAAATLCTIACNKEMGQENAPALEDEKCEITVGLGSAATKSTTVTDEEQEDVFMLQVFVFRGEQLDAYAKASSATEVTLSCTKGEREIYALVNDIDRSTISTKSALLACVSDFTAPFTRGFAMIGSKTETLPSASTITIDVNRLNSRIVLKSISNKLTSTALAALDFTVEEIFILNAPMDINLGLTNAPTLWKHKHTMDVLYTSYDAEISEKTIEHNETWNAVSHTFFCYPNPTVDDSQSDNWCARHTRLVVKVRIGTTSYYYPITLPVLQNNKSYEISNFTITRPGSDHPDKPVSFQDCTFDINVKPWVVVPVTDGTTI